MLSSLQCPCVPIFFSISLPLATNLAFRNNLVASLCFNPLLSNSTKIGQNKTKSFIFYVDFSTNYQEQINTGLSLFLSIFPLKKKVDNCYEIFIPALYSLSKHFSSWCLWKYQNHKVTYYVLSLYVLVYFICICMYWYFIVKAMLYAYICIMGTSWFF